MSEKVDFELWSRIGGGAEHYNAGDVIFSAGDAGSRMYVVRSGAVELLINGKVVETVPAHGMFGEMALLDDAPRSATARAKEACELAPIDQKMFLVMVDEAPYFALSVMRVMAGRLRRMGS
jgi:CRP/FNR family cyclic AMP-dependent transcriptional regulator